MYNKNLYDQVLNKKHHTFRRKFNKSIASDFTNREIAPVTRMAMRLSDVFAQEEPHILEDQKIVYIRTVTDVPSIFEADEWAEISSSHFIHELGYISNLCADYGSTIKVGLDCRKEEAIIRLERAMAESDADAIEFLSAVISQIDTVIAFSERYKAEAQRIGRDDVVAVLNNVPRKGAKTYREALQFFRILHYTLWAEGEYHNTIGRFDQFA